MGAIFSTDNINRINHYILKRPGSHSSGDKISLRWQISGLLFLTLLALLLRLYRLDYPLKELDEIVQYYSSIPPLRLIIPDLYPDHTPLFFFLSHFWLILIGFSHNSFLLRLPSAVFGTLLVPAAWGLALEISANRKVAWIATLAAAFAPFMISMSQYYRMYSLFMLLTVLSLYCLLRGLRCNELISWGAFVLFTSLNLYNHYNAIFVTLIEGIFGVSWLLINLSLTTGVGKSFRLFNKWLSNLISRAGLIETELSQVWSRLLRATLSLGAVCLLYLPWLPHLLKFLHTPDYGSNANATAELPTNFNPLYQFVNGLVFGYGPTPALGLPLPEPGFWLTWPLLLLGLGALLFRRFSYGLFCTCYLLISGLLVCFLPNGSSLIYNSRYLSFVVPVYLIVVAEGFWATSRVGPKIANKLSLTNRRPFWLVAAVPALLLAGLLLTQVVAVMCEAYARQSGIDEAGNFLKQNLQPENDTLFTLKVPDDNYMLARSAIALNFALIPDTNPRLLNHDYLQLLDENTTSSDLERLKAKQGQVWLAVFLPTNLSAQVSWTKHLEQAASSPFTLQCYREVCLLGRPPQSTDGNEVTTFQELIDKFEFLNPPVMRKVAALT